MGGAIALIVGGCHNATTPPSTPPSTPTPGTYNYSLNVANIRPLDTASGQYVLWLKMRNDTAWYSKPLTYWTVGYGSLDFLGTISLPASPDSIETAYVSMEPKIFSRSPTSVLMIGTFYPGVDSAGMSSSYSGAIGDYAQAQATAVFTTKSSDTNRARQEFYLMRLMGGVPLPSATNMPIPPAGWSYGLWVLDSNFYPLHKFFYGAFRSPDSSDLNPQNEEYPFPGGYNPAPLNDPGARLEVTLEPNYAIQTNRPNGPSPLTVLWGPLKMFINFNDSLPLENAWGSSALQGVLRISP